MDMVSCDEQQIGDALSKKYELISVEMRMPLETELYYLLLLLLLLSYWLLIVVLLTCLFT